MRVSIAAALAGLVFGAIAEAESLRSDDGWRSLQQAVWGERMILDGSAEIVLDTPYRTDDDARTLVGAEITVPEGRRVREVTVVLENNPAPVSAVVTLAEPQRRFSFQTTLRINGPTPLHVVAEMEDGALIAASGFVKTSGQGACSAPPGTDPAAALASLGDMEVAIEPGARGLLPGDGGKRARIALSHPSHSGLQMDQITLLFIPMRVVRMLDVERNGAPFLSVEGSISVSENPELAFSVPASTHSLEVTMTDTDGAVSSGSASAPLH